MNSTKLFRLCVGVIVVCMGSCVVAKGINEMPTNKHYKSSHELIAQFEGFRAKTYLCPAGVKTIGYGFTDKNLISKGTITRAEANKVLKRRADRLEARIVADLGKFGVKLTKDERIALTSFVYNVGWGNWKGSTLREKLIIGDKIGAANEFPRWNKVGTKVLRGLVLRRKTEQNVFNSYKRR